jgi:signal transduction histidine kinase
MNLLAWAARQSGRTRGLVFSALLTLGLVGVVTLDFLATRRELLGLLREQAAALRQTVAAAARSNREAARLAEEQLGARLLETARLLGEIDARGALDAARLDALVKRHELFRVAVFTAGGEIELSSGGGGGPRFGGGRGGDGAPGFGRGRGPGPGFGRGLLTRLLADGGESEAVTDVHTSRWGGAARVAAGVRRPRGGAIVVNVDASEVERLSRPGSLEALLDDVVAHAPALAYVVLVHDGVTLARGVPAPEAPASATAAEVEHELSGAPVMEFSGPVPLGGGAAARLRLGLRLDGLRRAERRMLAVLALTLATSLALAFVGAGVVWLQRKHELLGARHARAQEALRRRDRLAAMGELASTVAHEVRNPLNAIAMSAQRLRREFVETPARPQDAAREEATELLAVIESESQRLERTVRQFQEFARPKPLAPRPTSLGELVASVGETLRPKAEAAGVTLTADVAAADQAEVDPDLLRQALDNLARNALEATPAGGRVTLTARSDAAGHTLEVADTGAGIAPENLPRLFDLYFTTRPDGTGVGLAVTQQVIGAHGGTIEVDSQPGAGTRMSVRLPRAPAA